MNSVGTPNGTTLPRRGRVREFVASNPDLVSVCLYALVAAAMVVAADLAIFTVFQPYDDEGTLLVTLNAFTHGAPLYKDVYTEYGPFYYELFGGLFALSGHAVTTDASRTIVIVIWVSTAPALRPLGAAAQWKPCAGHHRRDGRLRRPSRPGQRADAPARPVCFADRRLHRAGRPRPGPKTRLGRRRRGLPAGGAGSDQDQPRRLCAHRCRVSGRPDDRASVASAVAPVGGRRPRRWSFRSTSSAAISTSPGFATSRCWRSSSLAAIVIAAGLWRQGRRIPMTRSCPGWSARSPASSRLSPRLSSRLP